MSSRRRRLLAESSWCCALTRVVPSCRRSLAGTWGPRRLWPSPPIGCTRFTACTPRGWARAASDRTRAVVLGPHPDVPTGSSTRSVAFGGRGSLEPSGVWLCRHRQTLPGGRALFSSSAARSLALFSQGSTRPFFALVDSRAAVSADGVSPRPCTGDGECTVLGSPTRIASCNKVPGRPRSAASLLGRARSSRAVAFGCPASADARVAVLAGGKAP